MELISVIYMTGCAAPFNTKKFNYIKRYCYCCPTDSPIDLIYPS